MSGRLLSDEFDPDSLDSNDYANSFENGEIFGPTAGLAEQATWSILPPPSSSGDVAVGTEEKGLNGLAPKTQLLFKTNYSCQECRVQLLDRPDLLHHHHPGQDKTTNDPRYTQLLCLDCHSRRENHNFMRLEYLKKDFEYIEQMRRKQGRVRK